MKTISLRDTASATWCESARNLTFGNRTRAFLSCCLLGLGTLNVSALEPKTAHQMQAASTSLNALLPLSARAADTGQRLSGQAITTHIDALIDAANAMRRHARTGDRELRVLASSFGLAVERVQRSLASGDPAWSYFSLLALAEQCAACHTRLPVSDERNLRGPTDSDPSIQFLSPVDLATIHIATRRYRQAADTLEQYLLTHNTSTDRSRLMEAFVTYFDLMIAVHRNHERPGALIDELIATSPLPIYLRAHLRAWKRSLETLSPKAEASVALGRKLFDAATRIALAPNGRERMIHDLVAASILRRALQSPHTLSADDQSESYLLLGLIALRTTELRPAIPQMEYLLQSAIRSAPHSEFAAKAYRLLEEFGVDAQEGPEDPSLLELPALRELMGADGAARTSVR